ncbi:MAG: hypothetical protein ACREIW_07445 [Chthoniobacterales bacterium]
MRRSAFPIILLLALTCASQAAERPQEQLNAIVRETQKQGTRSGRLTLVWWIPPEFWRVAFAASASVPMDKAEELISSIQGVNVFAVFDAKVSAFGAGDFTSAVDLEKNITLTDQQGKPLPLIPEAKQSGATKNMISMLKPLMANMLGEFGRNITFLVFEGKTKSGARWLDPLKPGSFTVKVNAEEFRWRLPLGSLLPDKKCPKCSETFPGNYAFCPFDASPLTEIGNQKP